MEVFLFPLFLTCFPTTPHWHRHLCLVFTTALPHWLYLCRSMCALYLTFLPFAHLFVAEFWLDLVHTLTLFYTTSAYYALLPPAYSISLHSYYITPLPFFSFFFFCLVFPSFIFCKWHHNFFASCPSHRRGHGEMIHTHTHSHIHTCLVLSPLLSFLLSFTFIHRANLSLSHRFDDSNFRFPTTLPPPKLLKERGKMPLRRLDHASAMPRVCLHQQGSPQ
mmetsp:Transcript_34888/g.90386  ORF Transcript_34888/g.90386 Transcript_34888/m.90386 type:complete len:220 (-) Transcript_34888:274-933(-)